MREYIVNVDFEIASVIFLLVFEFLVNGRKHLQIRRNICYRSMVIFVLLTNATDLSIRISNQYNLPEKVSVSYALNMILTLSLAVMLEFILLYMVEAVERTDALKFPVLWIINIPLAFYVAAVVTTPLTHFVFYISDENIYMRGPGHSLLYFIVIFYLLMSYVLVLVWGRKAELKKRVACQLFCLLFLLGCVLQWVFLPDVMLVSLFEIIGILILHFAIQSPTFYIDEATGAFNERGFIRLVREKLTREKTFALAEVSFDEFATSGNALLEQKLLRVICKFLNGIHGISCYRVDRDIYIYCKKHQMIENVCQKILERVKEPFFVGTIPYALEAKILIVRCPEEIKTVGEVTSAFKFFANLDLKYQRVYYYAGSVMKKRKRYEDIKEIVRSAIQNNELEMYYQPIYSVKTGKMDSAEALVRLKNTGEYGFISPEEFIPIAEEENLILEMEEKILEHVCRFIQTENLIEKGLRYIEVNLSGKQCREKHFAYKLSSVVEKCNIPAEFLNFEITETATIDMSQQLLYNMEKLIDEGYSFSLDDFGSGHSNLKRLSRLPLKIVKLDKDLIWSHFDKDNERSKEVLTYIVQMLQKLGLDVVAEGVETEEQKDELIKLNIQYLQGYYFSKPLPEARFLELLKQQEMAGRKLGKD